MRCDAEEYRIWGQCLENMPIFGGKPKPLPGVFESVELGSDILLSLGPYLDPDLSGDGEKDCLGSQMSMAPAGGLHSMDHKTAFGLEGKLAVHHRQATSVIGKYWKLD